MDSEGLIEDHMGSINNEPSSFYQRFDQSMYSDDVFADEVFANDVKDLRQKRVSLSWTSITAKANVKSAKSSSCYQKTILSDVSGSVPFGQLLAIMGHSGSGKTTLLNILNGRNMSELRVSGSVHVDAIRAVDLQDVHTAFIQQEDLFISTLTVREHLIFQAMIRLGHFYSKAEREEKVEGIIQELGLVKCADTRIGCSKSFKGISGGEMKRLSFATEMLDNPDILFCDEPTSGLDSFMAHNVVSVLKDMAVRGRTVLCTIHQPSSKVFTLFDRVLILIEGRVAFNGTRHQARSFFSDAGFSRPVNYNPADFYMQVLSSDEESEMTNASYICNLFEDKKNDYELEDPELAHRRILETVPRSRSPWSIQFRSLLWRSFLTIVREPLLSFIRFIQISVVSLLLGSMYFQQTMNQEGVMNINGALYLTLMCVTFQNLFGVISAFCAELPLFLREHSDGLYSTSAYFIGKTLAELPIFVLQPLIITTIVYFMIDLYQDLLTFSICCGVVILVANVVTSFGYFVSAACNSTQMALTVVTPLIIPLLIFGGYFVKNNTVPGYLNWIRYISWFHHGFQALTINQWTNVRNITCNWKNSSFCLKSGEAVLNFLHFSEEEFLMDVGFLVALLVAFRLLAFGALSIRSLEKR